MGWIQIIDVFLRALLRDRTELAAENLALRQQLAVLEHKSKRPRLRKRDRIFWVWLSRLWSNWRSVLVIVQAETVVRRHQQGSSSIGDGSREQDQAGRIWQPRFVT